MKSSFQFTHIALVGVLGYLLLRIWIWIWLGIVIIFPFPLLVLSLIGIRAGIGAWFGGGFSLSLDCWRVFNVVSGAVGQTTVAVALESLGTVAVESALRVVANGILVANVGARRALVDVQADLHSTLVQLGSETVVTVAPVGVLVRNADGVLHAISGTIVAGIRFGGHTHLAHGANAQSLVTLHIVECHLGDLLQHLGGTGICFVVAQAAAVQNPLLHLQKT